MSQQDRLDEQLHQTLGQEVQYLLLAIFVTSTLVLATMVSPDALQGKRTSYEQPPIITLSEAAGYSFASGSTELTSQFRQSLRGSIADQLLVIIRTYNVNVIEVVGHTDEVPVRSHRGSLDEGLLSYLAGNSEVALGFSDNAGLGMARAAAVMRELRQDPRFKGMKFVPLSGAQATPPEETSGGGPSDSSRARRVEIRVRRDGIGKAGL